MTIEFAHFEQTICWYLSNSTLGMKEFLNFCFRKDAYTLWLELQEQVVNW